MVTSTVEFDPDFAPPQDVSTPVDAMAFMTPVMALGVPGTLGSRDHIEKELDLIIAAIRLFHSKHPDQVMRECSAYTSRLTELTVLLHRVESTNRQYTRIRTQQVTPILAELDRQFKSASRMVEVSRQDLAVLGAQV